MLDVEHSVLHTFAKFDFYPPYDNLLSRKDCSLKIISKSPLVS